MSRSIFRRLNRRFGPSINQLSRRELLAATLATSAGLFLSGPAAAMAALGRPQRVAGKRVIIVGAGFAGLAAAFEMRAVGYDVTVVDARDRLGGRVLSFNAAMNSEFVPGRNIEGGGELIGSNHPAWVGYSEKLGLEFIDVGEDNDTLDPVVLDGKLLDDADAEKLWESMEEALGQMVELARPVPEDEPWNAPDAKALDARSVMQWIDGLEVDALTKRACWINQASDSGVDPARASLLGQLAVMKGGGLEKYLTDSEVYRCKGGNQQLAMKLAEKVGVDRIVMGLPVTEIDTRGSVVKVTCRDGRVIEGDDVVLAVPPTVWSKIQFNPGLPRDLTPQMGQNTKYLAHTKSRFWRDKKISQYALSDGPVEQTWDGTDGQDDGGPGCIIGFSGGPGAEKVLSWSKEERDGEYAKLLEQFFPGFKDELVAARMMDWPRDPWVLASYSFPAPGQVTTVGPKLAAGLGRLHFAGEHCCYKFVGYMEGALQSGIAAAKKLAKRDGV